MNITKTIDSIQAKTAELGARAMLAAANATGRAMNTRLGKAALVVPMAVSACTITASAEGADAQGMIDAIMGVLGPGVIALGSLVAVVGGIQTGVSPTAETLLLDQYPKRDTAHRQRNTLKRYFGE